MLDAVSSWLALDVVTVEGHVSPVEHRILRRPDVDECGFHPRQDVLDTAAIDVADDLERFVLRSRHVVLDEHAPL